MERKGLLGSLLIIVAVILLVVFGLLYSQIKRDGLKITTGKIVIDIHYDDNLADYSENNETNSTEISYNESQNDTIENISEEDG